jgi:hypothetical protein
VQITPGLRAVVRFSAEAIITLGALACILVWLNIKPKDIPTMMPHWGWLISGLALFSLSLASSVYGILQRRVVKIDPTSIGDAIGRGVEEFISKKVEAQRKKQEEATNSEPQLPAPPPKDPDLRGEVREIIFYPLEGGIIPSDGYRILMNLTITNHAQKQVVIRDWSLRIDIAGESVGTGTQVPIPNGWYVYRLTENRGERISEDLVTPSSTPYVEAIPKEGWLLFEFSYFGWGNPGKLQPPYNAQFSVIATDSLGGIHVFIKPSRMYFQRSEIRVSAPGQT